jgi:hypothetical protein
VKSWRDTGDIPCRQNHQEEAKLWPLHISSWCRTSPLHVKWRNQEGPWAASHPCPEGLGRCGQVLFYFVHPLWWDNYRTTPEAPSPKLETETDTKIVKTETSLHLNLEVFFLLIFFLSSTFHFVLFYLYIYLSFTYFLFLFFLFSILSLSL